jgi:hypothetical protein
VFLRIDKLQIELPRPAQADPEAAGVVQEGNYTPTTGRLRDTAAPIFEAARYPPAFANRDVLLRGHTPT